MTELTPILEAFIVLALLSVMIDKFTLFLQGVMKRIPFFPDEFEWTVAYIIVLIAAFLVCWQGSFDLFSYLGITFQRSWEGWLLTALGISGGSAFVRSEFQAMDSIPGVLRGVYSTVSSLFTSATTNIAETPTTNSSNTAQTTTTEQTAPEALAQEGETNA